MGPADTHGYPNGRFFEPTYRSGAKSQARVPKWPVFRANLQNWGQLTSPGAPTNRVGAILQARVSKLAVFSNQLTQLRPSYKPGSPHVQFFKLAYRSEASLHTWVIKLVVVRASLHERSQPTSSGAQTGGLSCQLTEVGPGARVPK